MSHGWSIVYHLSPDEEERIYRLAERRNDLKEAHAIRSNKWLVHRSESETHRLGLRAEYAVAKFLRLDTDDTCTLHGDSGWDLRLPDLRTVQVKYRAKRDWDFALENDNPASFYAHLGVLCWPAQDGQGVEIVGYTSREDFLRNAQSVDFGYGRRLCLRFEHMAPLQDLILEWLLPERT